MSEQVREPATAQVANGTPPSPERDGTRSKATNGSRPATTNGSGAAAANGSGAAAANGSGAAAANGNGAAAANGSGPETPVANDTDAALQSAVRAAAEVAELVRDSAIRRVRVEVADVRIEVERVDPGPARETVVTVAAEPAAGGGAAGTAVPGAAVAVTPGTAVAAVPGAAVAAVAAAVAPNAGTVPVTAPLMGVFYRRPGPDQPPFVEIGQRVEVGDQVAIVEAMKMMNPVVTDRGGIVRAVHATDGEVVEYEQALLSIEPG
ncbi:acetyl-CoA carboxylase biotin carboxyl carrier protein subunit [Micromonospora sp. WMMD1102]|uniref:acetyl-CoA carboxylase biotin carboxyl carrier protein n=1 Tax=Micromonospora sp. WMMD1102 TaxID=3016105 RepID=UPI002414F377|nr:acetyl-CoA carboxylase biotin carboxyl carrier protein subunit [Micromonospora sp. WMMD1102]MDG4786428.1 acetyl-CoA carboxylase biotin carboxyl carrier protein subunit [Micromonospora sp. WMMD1102]